MAALPLNPEHVLRTSTLVRRPCDMLSRARRIRALLESASERIGGGPLLARGS